MNCRARIKETETKTITEDDFDSYNKKESDDQKYGNREVVNEPLEYSINQLTPFISHNLLEQQFGQFLFTTDNFSYNMGIFSAGKPNGSSLRFMVQIEQNHEGLPGLGPIKKNKTSSDETGIDDSEKNSYDDELSDSSDEALQGRLTVGAAGFGGVQNDAEMDLGITKEEIQKRSEKDQAMIAMITKETSAATIIENLKKEYRNIRVDIFRVDTLEKIVDPKEFSMRVFVRSCQNLSAVDNKVMHYRNLLAGDRALSSADPYLYMQIVKERPLQVYDGRAEAKEFTLNPTFYID